MKTMWKFSVTFTLRSVDLMTYIDGTKKSQTKKKKETIGNSGSSVAIVFNEPHNSKSLDKTSLTIWRNQQRSEAKKSVVKIQLLSGCRSFKRGAAIQDFEYIG